MSQRLTCSCFKLRDVPNSRTEEHLLYLQMAVSVNIDNATAICDQESWRAVLANGVWVGVRDGTTANLTNHGKSWLVAVLRIS